MNPDAQKYLDNILKKEEAELTVHDIAFLKARISYVGKKSRAKFANVLGLPTPEGAKKDESPNADNPFESSDEDEDEDN